MIQEYLTGLCYDNCGDWDRKLSGLYVVSKSENTLGRLLNRNSYYYISDYATLGKRKQNFFKIIKEYQKGDNEAFKILKEDQEEKSGEWHRHHIVEKQHLKYFYSNSEWKHLSNYHWPCVLIHNESEHKLYTSRLHHMRIEPKMLFLNQPSNKSQLLRNIKTMYIQAYSGNSILLKIAQNVLSKINIS